MWKVAAAALALGCALEAAAEPIPVESPHWRLTGDIARAEQYLGRPSIFLQNGEARLMDFAFDTGVIEFDIATSAERAFHGIAFRGQDDANYENFYIRPHQSGNPDATQYTPVFNNVPAWQIFAGEGFNAATRYRFNEWMHVRVEVAADSARVFIDNAATPALVIHDLKRERRPGYFAFNSLEFSNVHFSNINITPGDVAAAPPARAVELPAGVVRRWGVSAAMSDSAAQAAARRNRLDEVSWTPVDIETVGSANLARVAVWSEAAPTALARVSLNSDRARTVRFRFGFSDIVKVYLNGALVYDGDDSYRSRDYRFLGTVGFYDAVPLPLRRGRNEIVLVVNEAFGGWAAAGAIEDMTGLTLIGQN